MACHLAPRLTLSYSSPPPTKNTTPTTLTCYSFSLVPTLAIGAPIVRAWRARCSAARRRVRYEESEEEDDEGEHNEEISMLEMYSQSARKEALIVHALVDDQEVEVLIFRGFSSSLSYETSSDPSKSILPARAVIKFIDRVEGPFDPSNIQYLEKGLTWEAFKTRLFST